MTALSQMRKARGMTQRELAEKSGVPFRTIQEYEQGRKSLDAAQLSTVAKLAEVLECALSDIVTDEHLSARLDRIKSN